MSSLMLPLPAGKKAPAHSPDPEGVKASPHKTAVRKKPRPFAEPRPGRKKSFRHHLDQALGKGFPAAPESVPAPREPVAAASHAEGIGKGFPVADASAKPAGRIVAQDAGKAVVLKSAPPAPETRPDASPVSSPEAGPKDSFGIAEAQVSPEPALPKPTIGIPDHGGTVVRGAPVRVNPAETSTAPAPPIRTGRMSSSSTPKVRGSSSKSPESLAAQDMASGPIDPYGFDSRLNGAFRDVSQNPTSKPVSDAAKMPGTDGVQATEPAQDAPAPAIPKGRESEDAQSGFSRDGGSPKSHEGDLSRIASPPVEQAPAPTVPVPARTSEPDRVPDFAEKVADTAKSGGGIVTLRVHPPELGPVVVTVQVDPRSKAVDVRLSVRDASVRDAIEGKGDALKRLLRDEGFSMHRLDVSLGEAGSLSAGAVQAAAPTSQSGAGTSGTFNSQASLPDFSGGTTLSSGGGSGPGSGGASENGSSAATDGRLVDRPEGSGDDALFRGTQNARTEHRGFHRIA